MLVLMLSGLVGIVLVIAMMGKWTFEYWKGTGVLITAWWYPVSMSISLGKCLPWYIVFQRAQVEDYLSSNEYADSLKSRVAQSQQELLSHCGVCGNEFYGGNSDSHVHAGGGLCLACVQYSLCSEHEYEPTDSQGYFMECVHCGKHWSVYTE